ncbi:hypothetical protein PAECIP111893_00787 [Paenibacillus plantiphilus]|uniref:GerMN domain-containing protein n=1 Tax=Paenibacillus plantiphilus TaxID=2905650 RepID=A0ABM9BXP6_9BACL|nr:GerMN domain-containing protein [Paenibacillus plantiphilus]CAH1195971.1 hypothetical protein PAECIP111893_00787 [Paenibacillus plantiphilus]
MNYSLIKRYLLVSVMIVVVVMISACGATKDGNKNGVGAAGTGTTEENPNATNDTPNTSEDPNATEEQPSTNDDPKEPEMTKETIKIYYPDDELMELGEQTAHIQYENDSKKAEAAFLALKKDGSNGEVSLWKDIELLSAKVEDGGAVVLDVHVPDEARLGAPGEVLALEAIQKTMFQFDGFQSLDILVDGKQTESLMGHDTLEHPYKK